MDLHFLYKDSDHNDEIIFKLRCYMYISTNNINTWNQSGLFHRPFVLQTFAAHFAVIEGLKKITSIHDPKKLTLAASSTLGLATAGVHVIKTSILVSLTLARLNRH